jgi:anti-sigma factor RsiW
MTHLSDEAVAAFADGVLRGGARERAKRHCAECAECNHAVAVQREAVWALRAAPAPALSSDLLERLRSVPTTTQISTVPTTIDRDGTVMFASFGAAALVPEQRRERNLRPFVSTTAVMAVAAALTAGSVAISRSDQPTHPGPGTSVTDLLPAQLAAHVERPAGR